MAKGIDNRKENQMRKNRIMLCASLCAAALLAGCTGENRTSQAVLEAHAETVTETGSQTITAGTGGNSQKPLAWKQNLQVRRHSPPRFT